MTFIQHEPGPGARAEGIDSRDLRYLRYRMITDLNTSMPSTSLFLSLPTAVPRYILPFDSKLRFSRYLVLDEKEMHVLV